MPGSSTPPLGLPVTVGPAGMGAGSAQTEPLKIYEDLKQKLKALTTINPLEPVLTATTYTTPLQPSRSVRPPNQRAAVKPKGVCAAMRNMPNFLLFME